MNININQGNIQENITSGVIVKLYQIATAVGNSVTLSGNLYSPSGYAFLVDYLNTQFAPNLTITVPDTGKYIYFEDSAVENVLKANGVSTDGIGISVSDANAATLTQGTFTNNTDITSFNEFSYFTRANTNPPNLLFLGCTNLAQINLSNATKISLQEFESSAITTVNAPNLESIGANAFRFCSSLLEVTNLGNTTSIPEGVFRQCTSLLSVAIPTSCTSIGSSAFYACSLLTIQANSLQNSVSIGSNAFEQCGAILGEIYLPNLITVGLRAFMSTNITSVTNLGSISELPAMVFSACRQLTTLTLPTTLRTIRNWTDTDSLSDYIFPEGATYIEFTGRCGSSIPLYIEYPSTVTDMGGSFIDWGRDHANAARNAVVVIKATTPPSLDKALRDTDGFGLGFSWCLIDRATGVYVPDQSVSLYKNDSSEAWSKFNSNWPDLIKPISQLETDSPAMWAKYNRTSTV